MSSTIDLAAHRDAQRAAFAAVCADNPSLGVSGHKCSWVPPPFTAADVDNYTPMFAQCVAWLRAFHKAAPGVNTDSDLCRDCMMKWRKLRGDTAHINIGVFIAAGYHLGIAGARRRGRPDVFIELRLGTVLAALDAWSGPDGDVGHPALNALEQALRAAHA